MAPLETFTAAKPLVANPRFEAQRQAALDGLRRDMIDAPIAGLITTLNRRRDCFTLQCCWGHFVHERQPDPHNLVPLPVGDPPGRVEYRIAYVGLCVDGNDSGRGLLEDLRGVTAIDPPYIQFGCAEWFWRRQVNSYVLQVEPERFRFEDKAVLQYDEALHVEKVRNLFFSRLNELMGA